MFKLNLTPKQRQELMSGIIDPRVDSNTNPNKNDVDLSNLVRSKNPMSLDNKKLNTLIDWVHDLQDRDSSTSKKIAKALQTKIDAYVSNEGLPQLNWGSIRVPQIKESISMNEEFNKVAIKQNKKEDITKEFERVKKLADAGNTNAKRYLSRIVRAMKSLGMAMPMSSMNELDTTIYGGGVNFGQLNKGEKFKFNPKDDEVLIKVSSTRYKTIDGRGPFTTGKKSGVYPMNENNMIDEGLMDWLKGLEKKFNDFMYNKRHQKNPEEWNKFLSDIVSVLSKEKPEHYAKNRQQIDRLMTQIYASVDDGDFVKAKRVAGHLQNLILKTQKMKKYSNESVVREGISMNEDVFLTEKAKSEIQQQAAGAALAAKRGEIPVSELQGASLRMYQDMTEDELEDFAGTKHDKIPEKVSESKVVSEYTDNDSMYDRTRERFNYILGEGRFPGAKDND